MEPSSASGTPNSVSARSDGRLRLMLIHFMTSQARDGRREGHGHRLQYMDIPIPGDDARQRRTSAHQCTCFGFLAKDHETAVLRHQACLRV